LASITMNAKRVLAVYGIHDRRRLGPPTPNRLRWHTGVVTLILNRPERLTP
jgi:hypothetical protein